MKNYSIGKLGQIVFFGVKCFASLMLICGVFLDANAQVTIEIPTLWDQNNLPPATFNNGITIKPGGELTIDGLTLAMNGKITVEGPTDEFDPREGGKLFIRNCTLKNQFIGNWVGIEVVGDNSEHFARLPDKNSMNSKYDWKGTLSQRVSLVEIKNSVIVKANIGVSSIFGGVIQILDNCQFIDCPKGVEILLYTSELNPAYNGSFVVNSEFIWNKTTVPEPIGIYLNKVSGVRIGGCRFINKEQASISYDARGYGIKSESSNFDLGSGGTEYCEDAVNCLDNCRSGRSGNQNEFENLSYGIKSNGQHLTIKNSNFKNCFYGVTADGFVSTTVANCTFKRNIYIDGISDDMTKIFSKVNVVNVSYDILLENSTFGTIYNNVFGLNNRAYTGANVVSIKNCGNMLTAIKNNSFSLSFMEALPANEVNAINIEGNCVGLNVFCNRFARFGTDLRMRSGSITSDFGTSANNPGKNTFSEPYSLGTVQRVNCYAENFATTGKYYFDAYAPIIENPSIFGSIKKDLGVLLIGEPPCIISCSELMELSVDEIVDDELYKVYPNPSKGSFTIESKNYPFIDVKVLDLNGNIIAKSNAINGSTLEMNLSNLESGLYLVRIQLENQSYVFKKISIN